MPQYVLRRKQVDELTVEWEKEHDKAEQTESLTMFLIKKQAFNGIKWLVEPCLQHNQNQNLVSRFTCKECVDDLINELKSVNLEN